MKHIKVAVKPLYDWQKDWLRLLTRINVLVAPRQHGKTYICTELIKSFVYSSKLKDPEILLVLPTLPMAYDLYENEFSKAFRYSKGYAWPNKDTKQIAIQRPDGGTARIYIRGSKVTPKSAKGLSPDFIVMDEAGQCPSETLIESLIPSTNKSRGKIVVTGTVEGGWWHSYYLASKRQVKKGNSTFSTFYFKFGDRYSVQSIGQEGLDEIKSMYDFDDEEQVRLFKKEQMCDWYASEAGPRFSKDVSEIVESDRLCRVPLIPHCKVGLTIDNGIGCTGVWFWQYFHGVPRFLKYQEWRSRSTLDICYDIKKWIRENNTKLGCLVMPHTIKKRNETDLKSVRDVWIESLDFFKDEDAEIIDIPKVGHMPAKYQALHYLLKNAIFDDDGCGDGLMKVRMYRPEAPKKETDIWSHATDSLSEFGVAYQNGWIDVDLVNSMYYSTISESAWEKQLEEDRMRFMNKKSSTGVFGGYY